MRLDLANCARSNMVTEKLILKCIRDGSLFLCETVDGQVFTSKIHAYPTDGVASVCNEDRYGFKYYKLNELFDARRILT